MFKKVLLLTCALGVTSFGSYQMPKDLGVSQKGEIVLTNLDINELFGKLPEIGIYGGCGMTFGKLGGGLLQEWDEKLKSCLVGHFRGQLDKESSRFKVADEGAKLLVNDFLKAHQGLYLKLLLERGHIYELTPAEGAVGGGIDKPVYYFSEYDERDLKKILGDKFSVKLSNTGTDKEACLHKEVVEKVKEDLLQEVWGSSSKYGPYLIDLACSMIVGGTGGRIVVRPSYSEGPNFDFEDNENVEEVMRGVYKGILRDKLDLYQDRDVVSTRVPYGIRLNQDRIRERVGRLVKEFPDKWIKILLERLKGYSESRNYFDKQDEKDKKGAEVCVSGIVVPIEAYLEHLCNFCDVAQEIVGKHKSEVEAIISRDREFIENVGHFFFNSKGEIEYHPFLIKPGYRHKGAGDLQKVAETEGPEGVWNFVLMMHGINRMRALFEMARCVDEYSEENLDEKGRKVLANISDIVLAVKRIEEDGFWSYGHVENPYEIVKYVGYFASLGKIFEMAGPSLSGELRELRIRMAEDGMGTLLDFTRRRVKRGEDYRYGEYVVEKKNRGKKTYQLEGDEEQLKALTSGLARIGKEVQNGLQSLKWEVFRICEELHKVLVNNEDKDALRGVSKDPGGKKALMEGKWGPSGEPLEEMSAGARGKLGELVEKEELWKKVFDRDDPMISLNDALDYLEHGLVSSGDGGVKSVFDLDLEDGGKGTFSIARGAVWLASNLNHVVEWATAGDEAAKRERWKMLEDEAQGDRQLDQRRFDKGKDVKI